MIVTTVNIAMFRPGPSKAISISSFVERGGQMTFIEEKPAMTAISLLSERQVHMRPCPNSWIASPMIKPMKKEAHWESP